MSQCERSSWRRFSSCTVSPNCTSVDAHPPSTEEKMPGTRLGVFRPLPATPGRGLWAHTQLLTNTSSLQASLHSHSAGKAFTSPSALSFVLSSLHKPVSPSSSSALSSLSHHSPERPACPAASTPFAGADDCFSSEVTLTVASWLPTVLPPQACWHAAAVGPAWATGPCRDRLCSSDLSSVVSAQQRLAERLLPGLG